MDITKLNNPIVVSDPTTNSTSIKPVQSSLSIETIPQELELEQTDKSSNDNQINHDTSEEEDQQEQQIATADSLTDESLSSTVPPLEIYRKRRTTKEYRMLYYYLLTKYRTLNESSKKLNTLETSYNKLIKYNELRNDMLLNTLLKMDESELKPLSTMTKNDELEKLKMIASTKTELETSLNQLIQFQELVCDLPVYDEKDSIMPDGEELDELSRLSPPRDELNQFLYLLEKNPISSIFNPYEYKDIFQSVQYNRFYNHRVSSTSKRRNSASVDELHEFPLAPAPVKRRKRAAAVASAAANTGLTPTGRKKYAKKNKKSELGNGDNEDDDGDREYTPPASLVHSSKQKNVVLKFENGKRLEGVVSRRTSGRTSAVNAYATNASGGNGDREQLSNGDANSVVDQTDDVSVAEAKGANQLNDSKMDINTSERDLPDGASTVVPATGEVRQQTEQLEHNPEQDQDAASTEVGLDAGDADNVIANDATSVKEESI